MPNQTRRYTWLYNPGCWVEEGELKEIVDSHDRARFGNSDPTTDQRIWKIFDSLCTEEVVRLIAESFCNKANSPGLGGIPAMRKYDIAMLEKAFTTWWAFPGLHHTYLTIPNNPDVMSEWMYTTKQLLVDTYHI